MVEFSAAIAEFEGNMQTKGYRPYTDSTGFLYLIVLARPDILKKTIERHGLKLRYSTPLASSSHPPCPVQHFRFPSPYPFSAYPVLEATLPGRFAFKRFSANRKLRVPIPNPWTHCLQLFESDAELRTYACYISYTVGRPGLKLEAEPLAPPGSAWDFSWDIFTKFFKLKTGVDWDASPDWGNARDDNGLRIDEGDAGMRNKRFEYLRPKPGLPQRLGHNASAEGPASETRITNEPGRDATTDRRPGVTMVMLGIAVPSPSDIDAVAQTPDGGW